MTYIQSLDHSGMVVFVESVHYDLSHTFVGTFTFKHFRPCMQWTLQIHCPSFRLRVCVRTAENATHLLMTDRYPWETIH